MRKKNHRKNKSHLASVAPNGKTESVEMELSSPSENSSSSNLANSIEMIGECPTIDIEMPSVKEWITFNVGGTHFQSSKETLTRVPSIICDIIDGTLPLVQNEKGVFYLDRDPIIFRHILKYLRTDTVPLPETNKQLFEEVFNEAQWFRMEKMEREMQKLMSSDDKIETLPETVYRTIQQKHVYKTACYWEKPVIMLHLHTMESPLHYLYSDIYHNHLSMFEKLAVDHHDEFLFVRVIVPNQMACRWQLFKQCNELTCINFLRKNKEAKEGDPPLIMTFDESRICHALTLLFADEKNLKEREISC